jgi:hypothetical protein
MITVLCIILAGLLLIIGLLVHGANTWGQHADGFFSWLTTKMGAGVTYRAEKVFPSHVVWYILSATAIFWALILRKH